MDMTAPAPTPEIVYLATRDHDDAAWTSSQQIAAALSRLTRVLVVEPSLSPGGLFRKGLTAGLRRSSEGLLVLRPFNPIPFSARCRAAETLSRRFLLRAIRMTIARLGFGDYQIWVHSPRQFRLAESLRKTTLIYKCAGEIATFPWLRHRKAELLAEEERLIKTADVIFCTSPSIAKRKAALNPSTFLVRLGVDAGLYARVMGSDLPLPADLKGIPEPRIGYVGALDAYKVDFELLDAVAREHPEWHWVLIGGTGVSDGTTASALPRGPNLHYLGVKPRAEIPLYLKFCSVLAVPYRRNDYTENLTTLKMHEYLATGKPVAATELPHFRRLLPLIRIASGSREFAAAIAEGLQERDASLREKRRAVAADQSWEKQAGRMLERIRAVEEKKNGRG